MFLCIIFRKLLRIYIITNIHVIFLNEILIKLFLLMSFKWKKIVFLLIFKEFYFPVLKHFNTDEWEQSHAKLEANIYYE